MQEINKMKQQIQDHLDKVILPFWESLKDDEYGGFYGYMDIDLNVDKKAVKGCILNNRILWFFANAYLNQKRPELLSYAKHAYEFLRWHVLIRHTAVFIGLLHLMESLRKI